MTFATVQDLYSCYLIDQDPPIPVLKLQRPLHPALRWTSTCFYNYPRWAIDPIRLTRYFWKSINRR